MRDAELRFTTLRMRIEERSGTARGAHLVTSELLLRHPGDARVTTTEEHRGTAGNFELWLSDGEIVRTYSAPHKLGTRRPVRHTVRGLDKDFPGRSRVYEPLTPLPMETLPDTFVHPAGYCQNVLSTGRCWVAGTESVGARPAVIVECDHPRTIELAADRPDFHIQLAVDREDGVILRLVESIGGRVTREPRRSTTRRTRRSRRRPSSSSSRRHDDDVLVGVSPAATTSNRHDMPRPVPGGTGRD